MTGTPAEIVTRTHHVGMSVADLGDALRFWEGFLGHPARVRGAGRPDTGDHGEMQVVCGDTAVPRTPKTVRAAHKALLPPTEAGVDAEVVPDAFDPRHAAHVKTYRS